MAKTYAAHGYNSHTRTTRRMVVEAELRHDWNLLRFFGVVLRRMETEGGSAAVNMLPGEHYFVAQLVRRIVRRVRKRLADEAVLWDASEPEPEAERAAREDWLRRPRFAASDIEYPAWHREAVALVDAMADDELFRKVAIRHGMFDRAAEADNVYREERAAAAEAEHEDEQAGPAPE